MRLPYDGALKVLITNFFLSFIPQSGVLRQPNVTHTRTSKNPTKPKIIQILVSPGVRVTILDKLESFQFMFNSNRFGRVTADSEVGGDLRTIVAHI